MSARHSARHYFFRVMGKREDASRYQLARGEGARAARGGQDGVEDLSLARQVGRIGDWGKGASPPTAGGRETACDEDNKGHDERLTCSVLACGLLLIVTSSSRVSRRLVVS